MDIWVIRHKPSKQFMPARMGKSYGGWSHWKPPAPGEIWSQTEPRIFFSYQSAANALSAWLQGVWRTHVEKEGSWEEGYYDVLTEPMPEAVPGRKREDMEIVPGFLTLDREAV